MSVSASAVTAPDGAVLVLATHNPGKLSELRQILTPLVPGLDPRSIVSAGSLGAPEPVENGLSFAANAEIKARALVRVTGLPAVADDSGLCVDVLGGAPGIFSARWCGRHGDDAANLRLLLDQIADVTDPHRTARFTCAAVLAAPARITGRRSRGSSARWRAASWASPGARAASATTRSSCPSRRTRRAARGGRRRR